MPWCLLQTACKSFRVPFAAPLNDVCLLFPVVADGTGEKPFVCEESGCVKAYATQHSLKLHKNKGHNTTTTTNQQQAEQQQQQQQQRGRPTSLNMQQRRTNNNNDAIAASASQMVSASVAVYTDVPATRCFRSS